MKAQIRQILAKYLSKEAYEWLEDTSGHLHDAEQLQCAFAQVPRKTGKAFARPSGTADEKQQAPACTSYFESWSADRLCRVYLLASYTNDGAADYYKAIERLFVAADVNELIALYSALPLFSFPESWTKRCAEGIRSNIGSVLEAIMYHNPYPADYLEQPAWNQMVLKAFFTDKRLDLITGLQVRNNRELAITLLDYVHERWAAGRTVHSIIWLLISPFAEATFMNDFTTVLSGHDEAAKRFLKEGIYLSSFAPAIQLVEPVGTGTI